MGHTVSLRGYTLKAARTSSTSKTMWNRPLHTSLATLPDHGRHCTRVNYNFVTITFYGTSQLTQYYQTLPQGGLARKTIIPIPLMHIRNLRQYVGDLVKRKYDPSVRKLMRITHVHTMNGLYLCSCEWDFHTPWVLHFIKQIGLQRCTITKIVSISEQLFMRR